MLDIFDEIDQWSKGGTAVADQPDIFDQIHAQRLQQNPPDGASETAPPISGGGASPSLAPPLNFDDSAATHTSDEQQIFDNRNTLTRDPVKAMGAVADYRQNMANYQPPVYPPVQQPPPPPPSNPLLARAPMGGRGYGNPTPRPEPQESSPVQEVDPAAFKQAAANYFQATGQDLPLDQTYWKGDKFYATKSIIDQLMQGVDQRREADGKAEGGVITGTAMGLTRGTRSAIAGIPAVASSALGVLKELDPTAQFERDQPSRLTTGLNAAQRGAEAARQGINTFGDKYIPRPDEVNLSGPGTVANVVSGLVPAIAAGPAAPLVAGAQATNDTTQAARDALAAQGMQGDQLTQQAALTGGASGIVNAIAMKLMTSGGEDMGLLARLKALPAGTAKALAFGAAQNAVEQGIGAVGYGKQPDLGEMLAAARDFALIHLGGEAVQAVLGKKPPTEQGMGRISDPGGVQPGQTYQALRERTAARREAEYQAARGEYGVQQDAQNPQRQASTPNTGQYTTGPEYVPPGRYETNQELHALPTPELPPLRETPRPVRTEEELRGLPGLRLRKEAETWGVQYDAPSTTIPRILDAQDRWRVGQMSDQELYQAVKSRGGKASNREANIDFLLGQQVGQKPPVGFPPDYLQEQSRVQNESPLVPHEVIGNPQESPAYPINDPAYPPKTHKPNWGPPVTKYPYKVASNRVAYYADSEVRPIKEQSRVQTDNQPINTNAGEGQRRQDNSGETQSPTGNVEVPRNPGPVRGESGQPTDIGRNTGSTTYTEENGNRNQPESAPPLSEEDAKIAAKWDTPDKTAATGDMFAGKAKTVSGFRGVPSGYDPASPGIGSGRFISPDKSVAQSYAGEGGVVSEESVTFKNPLTAKNWMEAKDSLGLPKSTRMEELVVAAKNAGHDGLIFENHNGHPEYVDLTGKEENHGQEKGQEEGLLNPTPPVAAEDKTAATGANTVEDINSGKALIDGLNKKIDEWVGMGTVNGTKLMDKNWERGAVKRLVATEFDTLMKGKTGGSWVGAKVAVSKAETFADLKAAVSKMRTRAAEDFISPAATGANVEPPKKEPSGVVALRKIIEKATADPEWGKASDRGRITYDRATAAQERLNGMGVSVELPDAGAQTPKRPGGKPIPKFKGKGPTRQGAISLPTVAEIRQVVGRGIGYANSIRNRIATVNAAEGPGLASAFIKNLQPDTEAQTRLRYFEKTAKATDAGLEDFYRMGLFLRRQELQSRGLPATGLPDLSPAEQTRINASPEQQRLVRAWNDHVGADNQNIRRSQGMVMSRGVGALPYVVNLPSEFGPEGSTDAGTNLRPSFTAPASGEGHYLSNPREGLLASIRGHLSTEARNNLADEIRLSSVPLNRVQRPTPASPDPADFRSLPKGNYYTADIAGKTENLSVIDLSESLNTTSPLIHAQPQSFTPPEYHYVSERVANLWNNRRNASMEFNTPIEGAMNVGTRLAVVGDFAPHTLRTLAATRARLAQAGHLSAYLPSWLGGNWAVIKEMVGMRKPFGQTMQMLVDRSGSNRGQGFVTNEPTSKIGKAINIGHDLMMNPEYGTDVLQRRVVAKTHLEMQWGAKEVGQIERMVNSGQMTPVEGMRAIEARLNPTDIVKMGSRVNNTLGYLNKQTRSGFINLAQKLWPFAGSESGMIPDEIRRMVTLNIDAPTVGRSIRDGRYLDAMKQATGQIMGGPVGTILALQALNLAITKMYSGAAKWMDQNDDGHKTDLSIGGGWYLSNLEPGLARASRILGMKEAANEEGIGKTFKNLKASVIARESLNEALGTINPAIKNLFAGITGKELHVDPKDELMRAKTSRLSGLIGLGRNTIQAAQSGEGLGAAAAKDIASFVTGANINKAMDPRLSQGYRERDTHAKELLELRKSVPGLEDLIHEKTRLDVIKGKTKKPKAGESPDHGRLNAEEADRLERLDAIHSLYDRITKIIEAGQTVDPTAKAAFLKLVAEAGKK